MSEAKGDKALIVQRGEYESRACHPQRYQLQLIQMIKTFRHKGLESFYSTGSKAGIQAKHADKIRLVLGRLSASREPRDMNLPGLRLHPLIGKQEGFWAVDVSGNWRITFRFEGLDVFDVDYLDYH